MQLPFTASDEILSAIKRLGRTEDVHFSPDNRRLAIAGFYEDRVLVLDVEINSAADKIAIKFNDYLEITSPSFDHPHGLFWIDNQTLIIANRDGDVPILKIPSDRPVSGIVDILPVRIIETDESKLNSPGSVSVTKICHGIYEILICNNIGNYISRHILDEHDDYNIVSNEILVKNGLNIPDGVAYSSSNRWIAVSNHDDHSVFMYKNDTDLIGDRKPCGILRGVNYPHGLRFSTDERVLLVADAGAPVVHVFASDEGDWHAERDPIAAIKVMDDETFLLGHYNPQEGGPKGIDMNSDNTVLVASCEKSPVAFFDLRETLKSVGEGTGNQRGGDRRHFEVERLRVAFARHIASAPSALTEARQSARDSREQTESLKREIEALVNSRSWRATALLRRLSAALNGSR